MKELCRREERGDDNKGGDVVLVFNMNVGYLRHRLHGYAAMVLLTPCLRARCTSFTHSTRAGAAQEGVGLWRVALAKRRVREETGGITPQSDDPFAQRPSRAPCTPGGAVPVRHAACRDALPGDEMAGERHQQYSSWRTQSLFWWYVL